MVLRCRALTVVCEGLDVGSPDASTDHGTKMWRHLLGIYGLCLPTCVCLLRGVC